MKACFYIFLSLIGGALVHAAKAQTIYTGPAVGNWGTAANWSTGAVPGAGDDVVIDNAAAQNSTVFTGGSQNRSALSLDITSGDAVVVDDNATLNIAGPTFDLDGTLTLATVGNVTNVVFGGVTALGGSGSLILGGVNNNSRILGAGTLTNSAAIKGRGQFGVNQLAVINAAGGVIDANVPLATIADAVLVIDPRTGAGLVNQGTLQATGGGIMQLSGNGGGAFQNDGGTIQAVGGGSEVQLLQGASVVGGTIHTGDGGLIRGNASQNYFFRDVTFDGGTQVRGEDNSDFGVQGTITNEGKITLATLGNVTDIELQADTVLAGAGEVVLATENGASNNARIHGSGILTNSAGHTVRGRGQIGVNQLGVVNNGTIRADVAGGGAVLFVDPSAAQGLDNNGLMEATGGGIMQLSGTGGGAFQNDGATIQAVGAGSEVQLLNGTRVVGGTLHTEGGGLIRGNASQNYFFDGVTFDAGTQVRGDDNSDFGVQGTITNEGEITIATVGNATDIELQADTVFAGAGEVLLATENGASNNARIHGSSLLTNGPGHTIRGRGQIGVNQSGLVNNGTIRADVAGGGASLLVDPASVDGLDNNGLMEATGGGILQLSGNGGGTFQNDGATIRAVGAGSEVQLLQGTTVVGGTLHTEDGGLIRGNGSQNFFFRDLTFDAGTQVRGEDNSDFGVQGTITNEGKITIATVGNATDIELQADTVFAGAGEVILATENGDSNNARIHGSGKVLTNGAEQTIRGRGQIGVNNMGVVNNGTIRAEVAGGAVLFIDPSAAHGVDNNGLMEATGGGIMRLSGNGGGAFQNDGAAIQAVGAGSEVQLQQGASVVGGTLHTGDGGLIRGNASQDYFFRDVTFDAGTQVRGEDNSDFGVQGTITNEGKITLATVGNATDIELQADTVFVGTGEVVLATENGDSNNARIHGSGILTNGAGHTIRGRGQIGLNQLGVFNASGATIDADAAGGVLFLDPRDGAGTFDNRGLLSASGGGVLQLSGNGGGSFDNTGGTIRANEGSETHLLSGVSISGGNLETDGTGLIRLLGNQAASIFDADLSGTMWMDDNASLSLSGDINHSGHLTINSAGNTTDLLIGSSVLELKGGGAVKMVGNNARILGNGVLINRDETIEGHGQIGVNQSALTNAVDGTIHANVDGGTLNLDPNAFLGFVNDGKLRASGGGALNLSGSGGGEFSFGDTSVVEALDGGSITHSSGAVLTNLQNGMLTGGTYRATDEGNGASIALPGGNILTNAATVVLSGVGAQFAQLGALAQNDGKVSVAKGAAVNTSAAFSNSAGGTLEFHIDGKPAETGLWGSFVTAAAATLGGTLDVFFNMGESFAAAVGDTWKIFTSATRTGEFAAVNFMAEGLPANSSLGVNYLDDGVEVEVKGAAPLTTVSYASWIAGALPAGGDTAPHADPDRDGASNLEEYAFAMDPGVSDAEFLPRTFLLEKEGLRYLAITYDRPALAGARPDITYTVERSTDLRTWTSGDAVAEADQVDQDLSQVTVRCAGPIGRQAEFLRVAVAIKNS